MSWDLTPDEQAAIMDAAWHAIQPHWELAHHKITLTYVDNSGERPLPVTMPGVSDDAPETIKALERVYSDIVDRGGPIGGAP